MLIDRGPFKRASLKRYISHMSKPDNHAVFDDIVAQILEQQGFTWDEDPRSIYEPEQLYIALERYATDWTKYEKVDDALAYGFRKAYSIFAKPRGEMCLKPLTDSEVVTEALKLEKSSGLPMMTTKAESLMYSFDRELQVRQGHKAPNPCVAYKRTQANNKTRLVWGYPLEMTIMEGRFARPLITRFINHRTPMAFGMSKCELGAKLDRYFNQEPGTTVCLDYSKFDSTISACCIREAFRILETWFTDEDREALGWETIVKYFITTPIVMPNGHLYTGKNHGVPSGSYFTQMIDSIVNVAVVYSLKWKCGMKFKPYSLYVLGDDVIVQVRTQVDLEMWSKAVAEYGLIIHDDEKTRVGETHFLGAIWNKGKPDAPVSELTKKAVFPEKFRNYGEDKKQGAEDVLRSFASNYLSAYRFLIRRGNVREIDLPSRYNTLATKYMTGSDKFLYEERRLVGTGHDWAAPAALALRILL